MSEWRDADGYPTDAALDRIEHWDGDHEELLAFVASIWWNADWGWHQEGRDYYVSTGGWSGNESIIAALQANILFWSLCFESRRSGGHYMFCLHDAVLAHDLCGKCKGTGFLPIPGAAQEG